MPPDDARERSASPLREEKRPKASAKGFKWKEKRPRDEVEARGGGRLERGYRDRSPRRDSYRERRNRDDEREQPSRYRDRSPWRAESGAGREGKGDQEEVAAPTEQTPSEPPKEKKEKKEKKPKPAAATSSEPMIIVNVNDRLGTKAAIPCLASDSVKAFKAMVAAQIGRQPHEIMIKRQGERPFKDVLSLADYGVSHGVQLDLELDTGD